MKRNLRQASVLTAVFAVLMLASPCFADDLMKCQASDWAGQTLTSDQKTINETRQYFDNESSTANKQFYSWWHQVDTVTPAIERVVDFQDRQQRLQNVRNQVLADQTNDEKSRVAAIRQSAQDLQTLAQEPANTPGVHLDAQSSNLYVRNYR